MSGDNAGFVIAIASSRGIDILVLRGLAEREFRIGSNLQTAPLPLREPLRYRTTGRKLLRDHAQTEDLPSIDWPMG